jgi:hypothetical protein
MRRFAAILFSLAAFASGASLLATAPPAGAQVPPDDPARGLIYSGLRRAGPDSICRGAFEVPSRRELPPGRHRTRCTHGPDPVPADLDPRPGQEPGFLPGTAAPAGAEIATAAATGTVGCYGTGTDGYRVQLVYAREPGTADRYPQFEASFHTWAARVDDIFNASAAKTGGIRHIRYVTDAQCRPLVQRITLSAAAVNDFSETLDELEGLGLDRADRKYLLWVDTPKTKYCGIGLMYDDRRASTTPGINANNGNSAYGGLVGRVDTRCWGQANPVEAHELLHTFGGVLGFSSAIDAPPHATNNSHCTDESDRLCYADGEPGVFKPDGSATSLQFLCPASHEVLLDCGNDDYFAANPPQGNWLRTHWNTANSAWLAAAPPPGTAGSVVAGNTWFAGGTTSKSGPAGTSITSYATNALANVPYQLVTGRSSPDPSQPCALDLVAVNSVVVYASPSGRIGQVTGTVNRLPGTYQVCFAQADPVGTSRAVTGVTTFTVT